MVHNTVSHALIKHFSSTRSFLSYINSFTTMIILLPWASKMAKTNLHLLSFLFFLGLFNCTLSLINPEEVSSWLALEETEDVNMVQTQRDSWKKCDFSVGKWIFDQTYPLYDSNCPYLATAVTCQKNGRPDSDYEKWKWKPLGCSIPRWWWNINCSHCYLFVFLHACIATFLTCMDVLYNWFLVDFYVNVFKHKSLYI